MTNRDTIQILREIIAEMGLDNVCQNPHAFAGAILDMCDVDDVKLLTTVLRSHYSTKLMDWFRNGGNDAATWMQQKTFLINESGMSVENAESVLGMLWQAMDWQQLQPLESASKELVQSLNGDYNAWPASNGYDNGYNNQPASYGYKLNGAGYEMEQRLVPMPIGSMIALSVVAFVFFSIGGIVTLVKTLNINNAVTYAEQQARYASAKKWGIISIIIGVILTSILLVVDPL